ncbi:MAG: metallophosphoesterase (TIGR00282 family) [Saprospiraceae bacterium]|jgi:metallophosphoesterase (TIGR00282 family)
MKILAIGDVVAKPGRRVLQANLAKLQQQHDVDFTVVNIENAAGGSGITRGVYKELCALNIDVMTSGNHIFNKKEVLEFIDDEPTLLRPHNFPKGARGSGVVTVTAQNGVKVTVMNLMGQVFMHPILNCPFEAMTALLEEHGKEDSLILLDFHAETTSEKIAMGWFVDGKIAAQWGTHTHVQTADERVLPDGTAFICDLGMTGAYNSVIGVNSDIIVEGYVTKLRGRFDPATGPAALCGALIDVDETTKKARSIQRIRVE